MPFTLCVRALTPTDTMIAISPPYLKRYKDIAWLLYKYGGSDFVRQSGLNGVLHDAGHSQEMNESAAVAKSGKPLPEQLADDLESLGPAFVKLGQLLSTRPDILPSAYLDALSRLQDKGKPAGWPEIERVLEEEFQTQPDRIFDNFDRTPIAAASLGQVYRASLHDGRRVIVKVQRPDIIRSLNDDLAAFAELAELLHNRTELGRRWQIKPMMESLSRNIASELDYRREAHDSHLLADNLRQFDRLQVPQAIDNLTRPRVLTMEHVEGVKITEVSHAVLIELDRKELNRQLFRGYLQQVLIDGVFHSDPHPGNLLLTRDGRIALLDFGMITRVSAETRTNLVKLLLAVSRGEGEEAARVAEVMSQPTPLFKRHEFVRQISYLVADQQDVAVEQMGTGRVIMNIHRAAGEAGIIVPECLMMLGKTLMNLDRVVTILDPTFNPTAAVRDQAMDLVQQHSQRRLSLTQLYQAVLDTTDLMQSLPSRISTVTKRLADNELEIKVRAFDEIKFIRGLHKVANRIAGGLVIAALIVGASHTMNIDAPTKIFGYPALPLVMFLVASIAGLILLWRGTMVDDVDERN